MTAPQEMLPCPFCGDDNASVYSKTCRRDSPYNPADRAFPIVRCNCGVEVPGKDWTGVDTAISAWNHRTPPVVSRPAEVGVSVPREPTEAMLAAAMACPKMRFINGQLATVQIRSGANFKTELGEGDSALIQVWKAMLSAAPQPTEDSNERP